MIVLQWHMVLLWPKSWLWSVMLIRLMLTLKEQWTAGLAEWCVRRCTWGPARGVPGTITASGAKAGAWWYELVTVTPSAAGCRRRRRRRKKNVQGCGR
ncbi:hypothetical protein BCR44DRAFT_342131 [Catenaria anguillulae PL171]|uniref:Secreted protein n=1 Tax=Catenaria anguillulae PL171 TaxID=765915 RepID=A0A1Y2I4L7_9FUNG|nr:hypothetical protein BCR44DRAFT_342131 [Catenaria anguillulae PL171]